MGATQATKVPRGPTKKKVVSGAEKKCAARPTKKRVSGGPKKMCVARPTKKKGVYFPFLLFLRPLSLIVFTLCHLPYSFCSVVLSCLTRRLPWVSSISPTHFFLILCFCTVVLQKRMSVSEEPQKKKKKKNKQETTTGTQKRKNAVSPQRKRALSCTAQRAANRKCFQK